MSLAPPDTALDVTQLRRAHETTRAMLLAEQSADGCWIGHLSSSALSTATAVSAFSLVSRDRFAHLIGSGLGWLQAHQNGDGGWGDTDASPSNLSTTLLAVAALQLAEPNADAAGGPRAEHLSKAMDYVEARAGRTAQGRARALCEIYGKDRTFATPILANCALADEAAGLGNALPAWRLTPSLPFELGWCPRRWFRSLRLTW